MSQGSNPESLKTRVAPPPTPADVGIVAALPLEIKPFLGRLKNVRKYASERHSVVEGEYADRLVVAILSGPGRKAAARAAQFLWIGHRPRWMISAGFAGALDPTLRRNDLVLASEVIDPEGHRFSIDVSIPEEAESPRPDSSKIRTGRLLTVDKIIRTAAEKAGLRDQHQADLIDMESSAIAALCHERSVRFLSVRVISDHAQQELPPEILTLVGPTGSYRVGAAIGAIWKRPSSLVDMLELREHAHQAADQLDKILRSILKRMN
jgi:adenosylhomocysteine nucleosidase